MNLLKAAASVSAMTLLSRITGFARDTLIAVFFGAGALTDAFFVAFRIPNLLRRLFAEGAFSQAFVPVVGEYRSRQGEAATRRLAPGTGLCRIGGFAGSVRSRAGLGNGPRAGR